MTKNISTSIRIPDELCKQIKELAEKEGRSINNVMIRLIAEGIKNTSNSI